jgi:formylglycine-generating enzyme required for sulfatase activity
MDNQKTVFISYRRKPSRHLALLVYKDLQEHGWDVFLDTESGNAGDLERIILPQIAARAHFVLVISPDSLARCRNAGDWVLREIEEALRHERNFVPLIEQDADFIKETDYLPERIRTIVRGKAGVDLPNGYFDAAMDRLRTRFLSAPAGIKLAEVPVKDRVEIVQRKAAIDQEIASKPTSLSLMPAPFEWVEIPGGRGTMRTDVEGVSLPVPTERYWMAKYPVTNAQYALFVEAGGYDTDRWWTKAGWDRKKAEKWTEPRYWSDSEWNGAEYPVVGVSRYEALAFCLWLSEVTDEAILLPTEAQWQYAAQGDDGRTYPWGNDWDCKRCNNSVKPCASDRTTPVTQYAGRDKGDSPFGVTDMAGNVWEWCLTDYDDGRNDIHSNATKRVLRGGSWFNSFSNWFRCDYRHWGNPRNGVNNRGFRVSRS